MEEHNTAVKSTIFPSANNFCSGFNTLLALTSVDASQKNLSGMKHLPFDNCKSSCTKYIFPWTRAAGGRISSAAFKSNFSR
jgi:hypothetical protein